MKTRPKILITNDDGVEAPGIRHLWEALHEQADCTIVAPATEQSGRGCSITIHEPVRLQEVEWYGADVPVWKVTGTPVDAVKLALGVVMADDWPDLIVSGINNGSNAGRNLLYSGTVGCVVEGAIRGIPGIAFSCVDKVDVPYAEFKPHVPKMVDYVIKHPLPAGTVLNVNYPAKSAGDFRGFRLASQGNGYWTDAPMERVDHNDLPYYWLGGRNVAHEEEESADVALLDAGYATAVPFQACQMTNHHELNQRRETFETLLNA